MSIRQAWKKTFELAFNSKNKFMVRIFTRAENASLETTLSIDEAKEFKNDDM
jgi:sodium/potassium-transporting ATPase subunit alpha